VTGIVSDAVYEYVLGALPEPDRLLAEMQAHAAREGVPVVTPDTGRLLHVLALASGARRVVEIGTAIGVSTLHLARALPAGGTLVSFEVDPDRHAAARRYLERGGVAERADLRLEDAAEGLEAIDEPFDLAFIDALKRDYRAHLERVLPRLRPGGLVVADNVLLSGTVATERPDGHWSADHIRRMREFNRRLLEDPPMTGTILPVGDGVALAVKRIP
jgi:caffeoyl-CoA O-methyltransferase